MGATPRRRGLRYFGVLPPEENIRHPKPVDAIVTANTSALPIALRRLSDGGRPGRTSSFRHRRRRRFLHDTWAIPNR